MTNDPRKLKLRIETLDTDDVAFFREMIVARMREVEGNKKLDPQERTVLTNKYKRLNALLSRRFNKASGPDNPRVQFRASVPGHVIIIDERMLNAPVDTLPAIPTSVVSQKVVQDSKYVGVIGTHDGVRVLKDRTGVNEEVEIS